MAEGDYGDVAVDKPAGRVLDYGQQAVDSGAMVAAGPAPKPRKKSRPPPSKLRLTVNPASRLSALQWARLLKKSTLPKKYRQGIVAKPRNREVLLPPSLPASKQAHPQWMRDFVTIGDDWELTTGTLEIVISAGRVRGNRIVPDLQSGSGAHSKEMVGVYDATTNAVFPRSVDIKGARQSYIFAKTAPPLVLQQPGSEVALLRSGRGLIIVAVDVKAKDGDRFAPDPPARIHEDLRSMNLLHEIAAHAGFLSNKMPAAHGEQRVDENIRAIEHGYGVRMSRPLKTLLTDIMTYIGALLNTP